MGWFTKKKNKALDALKKPELWTVCPSCTSHIYKEEWDSASKVCPKCNFHDRLTCHERIRLFLDEGSFEEIAPKITFADPLKFEDAKGKYSEKAAETRSKTGLNEAVITGKGTIKRRKILVSVMDFRFLGGSLGGGTGEKILQGAEYALKRRRPYIIFSASGGARMHEGIISLMQMAKTCAAIGKLKEAGIPYISILTHPTTGGVSASYAMMGDLNIAEPGALIGFAGRRVIEQTIRQKLPADFQTAEYVRDHGFVDMIVPRKDMKDVVANILQYWQK